MMEYDLEAVLCDFAKNVIVKIQENLESTGTNASGRTSDSLEYEVVEGNRLIIKGRPYFRGVEEGRPGGGIPHNMTSIISKWIDDKGIASHFGIENERQQRSVAYLIGQKIKREGTELYRNGGRDDIYTNVINDNLDELQRMVTASVIETIVKNV